MVWATGAGTSSAKKDGAAIMVWGGERQNYLEASVYVEDMKSEKNLTGQKLIWSIRRV